MIYIFYGDDSFSIHEALRKQYEEVGPQDLWTSNVSEVDGASFELAQLLAVAQAMPFLALRRLVIVRGLLTAAEPQRQASRRARRPAARGAGESHAPGLAGALQALPPTTDVAFVDARLTPANLLLKEIGPLATVQEFPYLRRDVLAQWVRDRMAQKGGAVTNQAIAELVDLVGSNLWAMDTELEKLAIYCQERAAGTDDVRMLVTSAREATVFTLVDAIMEGRTEAALRVVEQLMKTGSEGPSLLSMVARQARFVALAQELAQLRVSPGDWGGRLGITQGFVLRKTVEQSRRFSRGQVHHLYQFLLEADLAMKRGEMAPDLALIELVTRMAGERRVRS